MRGRACLEGCTCGRHRIRACAPDCDCSRLHPIREPWQCRYCGTQDEVFAIRHKRRTSRAHCKRCLNAWYHKVPYALYEQWLLEGCRICGITEGRLEIDHDHACCAKDYSCANCYRGLLCSRHNTMVGVLEDTSVLAVFQYLVEVGTASPLVERCAECLA